MKTEPNKPIFSSDPGRGLTTREYFAAMAMQGLCCHDARFPPEEITHDAVIFADALIEALNKTKE